MKEEILREIASIEADLFNIKQDYRHEYQSTIERLNNVRQLLNTEPVKNCEVRWDVGVNRFVVFSLDPTMRFLNDLSYLESLIEKQKNMISGQSYSGELIIDYLMCNGPDDRFYKIDIVDGKLAHNTIRSFEPDCKFIVFCNGFYKSIESRLDLNWLKFHKYPIV
jgi:hypothetical protein